MPQFKHFLKIIINFFGYKVVKKIQINETDVPVNYNLKSLVPRSDLDFVSDLEYAISVGENYLKDIHEAKIEIKGKEILEIGPGINFGSALILLWNGAKSVTVIDKYLSKFTPGYHGRFYHELRIRYFERDRKKFNSNLDGLTPFQTLQMNSRLVTKECGLESISDSTFDITLSCAVLEHVENPLTSVRNLYSITKLNGYGIHQIDFRDHRNFDKPLEYLLLDEMTFFKLFKSVHGECGNRTRACQWLALFRQFFGDNVELEPNMWVEEAYFKNFIARLNESKISNFTNFDASDLSVLSGKISYKK